MSQQERETLTIMRPVLQGERTQAEAARLLGLRAARESSKGQRRPAEDHPWRKPFQRRQ